MFETDDCPITENSNFLMTFWIPELCGISSSFFAYSNGIGVSNYNSNSYLKARNVDEFEILGTFLNPSVKVTNNNIENINATITAVGCILIIKLVLPRYHIINGKIIVIVVILIQ